jgi:hypothetical protein
MACIRRAMALREANGLRIARALELQFEADYYASEGRFDDALVKVADALSETEEVACYRAQILRLRADLSFQTGAQNSQIETAYCKAIECARSQNNKFDELRSTTQFARWLKSQGSHAEARMMLAEIYNWFTEGFDTADLKDAKALLDELNQ